MATFHLRILTPKHTALDDEVVSIVVPGESGYLGALANHAPLITNLAPGRLKVILASKKENSYHIGGGILKIIKNQAVILTESVEDDGEV